MLAARRRLGICRTGFSGTGVAVPFALLGTSAQAQQTLQADMLSSVADTLMPLLGLAFLVTLAAWAVFSRHAIVQSEEEAQSRAADLEQRLHEAEALLAAEPHLLFVWTGNDPLPDRVGGTLPDVKGIPSDPADQIYFAKWLEVSSSETLSQGLATLKKDGTAFNFVVRTRGGDLLEADGRTAGSLATLRLRGLTGERLEMSQLVQKHRGLEQRAAMLIGILNQAPHAGLDPQPRAGDHLGEPRLSECG